MLFFQGLNFYIYLFILFIPAVILGLCQKSLSRYRCLLSIIFIYLIYKDNSNQLKYLILYSIFSVYLVVIYCWIRDKAGRNKFFYFHAVLFAILPLIICKLSLFQEKITFGFLGISYITFRVVQVIIETYDGVITEIDPYKFLNFILFFPTISSGPIDRSRRFIEDEEKIYSRNEYLELVGTGIQKLFLGLFYKIVLSALFYGIQKKYFFEYTTIMSAIGYAYVYGFYMFFDFAGYSLLAVGTSYILGIKVPDNFNKPFIALDMKDFWNRWHITLSTWFRDFIFTRFTINSMRKKRFSSRLECACVAFIVNMGIMGVWHGFEMHYIFYGLYHGLILAITEVYQRKSKIYKKFKNKPIFKFFSWVLTLNIVMFGFFIFTPLLPSKNVIDEVSRTDGVIQLEDGSYEYSTNVEENVFSYIVLQLYNPEDDTYSSINTSTGGRSSETYIHQLNSGEYYIILRANSNKLDEYIQYKCQLKEGAKYKFEYVVDEFSSTKIKLHNFSFKEQGGSL